MKKIICLLITIMLLTGCTSNSTKEVEEETKTINTFDSNLVCTKVYDETIEDDELSSTSNIFIYYDEDEYVTKAIYQSISDASYYNNNLLLSVMSIIDMYNELDGVSAQYYIVDDKIVMEFSYDYETIDIDTLKSSIGELLSEDNIFNKVKKIPVKLDKFKSIELIDYDCQ